MLESVISTLGLSTDTAHLKDQITILHPADTHILRIVAADSSTQRAADIANALAALALDDLSARMGTTPDRKSTRLNSSHASKSRMPSSA